MCLWAIFLLPCWHAWQVPVVGSAHRDPSLSSARLAALLLTGWHPLVTWGVWPLFPCLSDSLWRWHTASLQASTDFPVLSNDTPTSFLGPASCLCLRRFLEESAL